MTIVSRDPSTRVDAGVNRLDLSFLIPAEWLPWVRAAIILGVLAGAAGLTYVAIDREEPALGLAAACAPLLALGALFVMLNLKYAPALIMFVAAFVPFSLPTGTSSRLVISLVVTMLLIGLWALRMWLVEKRFYLRPLPANLPVLGFMVVVLVSVFWSNVFMDPLVYRSRSFPFVQGASTVVMIMLPGAFLLAANLIDDLKIVKAMVAILLAAGVVGLFKQYEIVYFPFNVGGLYTMWVIVLSAGLGMFAHRLKGVWRGLFLALAGVWLVWGVILHISWVSGWLPGMVAIVVLISLRSRKLAALAAVGVLVVVLVNRAYFSEAVSRERTESGNSRLMAWAVNWRVTGKHWLFGTGPAGYAAYYMSYFPEDAMATHSNYVDILAQTGVVGFGFYIAIFGVIAWMGYQLCRRLKGRGDFTEALANSLLAGVAASIVAMALGDWLIPFAYTQTIAGFDHSVFSWLLMGLIPALDRLAAPGAEAAADA
jgi:O-antigen ligase